LPDADGLIVLLTNRTSRAKNEAPAALCRGEFRATGELLAYDYNTGVITMLEPERMSPGE
jgi:hypothetical protein